MSAFRWTLAALGVLTGLAGVGALYQLISKARDKSKSRLPGKLVDVGATACISTAWARAAQRW